MASTHYDGVLRHIRVLARPRPDGPAADADLLRAFAVRGDRDAFAALVRRHGPMVLGVCRRALPQLADAEDAFQATFILLARRAAAIRRAESLASWLHGAAHRMAADIRKADARRRRREAHATPRPPANPAWEAAWREVQGLLDAEIERLPAGYREPFILCCLEHHSRAEAARRLGLREGTVWSRLAKARELLRQRLARRGVSLASLLGAVAVSESAAPAAVPGPLVFTAIRAAQAAAGAASAGALPSRAALLAEGAMKAMTRTKLKAAVTALLAVGILGTGAGVVTHQMVAAKSPADDPPPAARPADVKVPQGAAGRDEGQQPLPAPDAAARLLWAVTEAVVQHHVNPPAREAMLLAGVKALLEAVGAKPPDDLDKRLAAVTSREQLAGVLQKLLPESADKPANQVAMALLNGVLSTVPGEPGFLPAEAVRVAEQLAGNRYVGIGIQIRMDNEEKVPQIVTPFGRGPAWKAGIRAGDRIVAVDGRSTQGVELNQVVQWLRGPEGTAVSVGIRRPGESESRTVRVTRTVVPIESVLGFRRAPGDTWTYRVDPQAPIGYVWVNAVNSSTLHELRQAEPKLRAEGVRALVLDLRLSNAHGDLHHAELLADGLLDDGLMWRVRGAGGRTQVYRADRECLFRDWPLAILLDKDTGIGDVVAAALQDNGRAVLVGQPTARDGWVRSAVALPGGVGSVTLRTGRLERPSGRDWPLQPDVSVVPSKEQAAAVHRWLQSKQLSELPAGTDDQPPDDPQLRKAIEVLRAKVGGH